MSAFASFHRLPGLFWSTTANATTLLVFSLRFHRRLDNEVPNPMTNRPCCPATGMTKLTSSSNKQIQQFGNEFLTFWNKTILYKPASHQVDVHRQGDQRVLSRVLIKTILNIIINVKLRGWNGGNVPYEIWKCLLYIHYMYKKFKSTFHPPKKKKIQ